jgi:hypothetical protein
MEKKSLKKTLRNTAYSGLAALTLLSTSCATVVSGTSQDISINTEPVGADIKVNGMHYGKTPSIVNIKRKGSHSISLSKEGYHTIGRPLSKSLNWWVTGNILIGGLIGLVVDFASGGAYKLYPENIHINLPKDEDYENPKKETRNGGSNDLVQKLLDLKKLKDVELITEEEYKLKRKNIIEKY